MKWYGKIGREVNVKLDKGLVSAHFVVGLISIRVFHDIYDVL